MSLKSLKNRIKATKGVKKTTKTMELISSVYLRKFQSQVRETKKFAEELENLKLILDQTTPDSYLFEKPELPKVLIVFSAFRGLNGNFDALVRREVLNIGTSESFDTIIVFGRKASIWAKNLSSNQIEEYEIKINDEEKSPAKVLKNISAYLRRKIINEEIGQIQLISTRLEGSNYFPQKINLLQSDVIPVSDSELVEEEEDRDLDNSRDNEVPVFATQNRDDNYKVEFDKEFLNEYILENHLYSQLYLAYFESLCAENLARTFAMKQSTKAATEMIDKFTLKYNKARQGKITQEVSEIISGMKRVSTEIVGERRIVIKI